MRTEKEIRAAQAVALEKLREAIDTLPQKAVVPFQAKVKELSQELSDCLSEGAEPCGNVRLKQNPDTGEFYEEVCGVLPMGMVKTPSYIKDGLETPTVYEVGCLHCPPILVEHPTGDAVRIEGKEVKVRRRSLSARAYSIADAVQKWNDGNHIEDNYLQRIPGFVPDFVDPDNVAPSPGPVTFKVKEKVKDEAPAKETVED